MPTSPHVVELADTEFAGCQLVLHTTLDTARERWLVALATGAGSVFQTWDWNAAWYDSIGRRQGVLPRIVELRDRAGQTVLLWPLGLYRRQGLRVLDFLGEVVTDYPAPVIVAGFPGQDDPASFERLWRHVVRLAGPSDVVDLRRMPATLDGIANPMARLARAMHSENAYGLSLPDSVAALHASQTSRRLADNRRKLRRLAEFGEVKTEPDHAEATRDAVIRALAEQKSRRWRETGSRDLFQEPGYLEFYRTLQFTDTPGARINIASLSVDENWLATHWGLIFRGRYYWILPTYADEPWLRYSCGRLLLQTLIEWSIDQGLQVFDMTVGEEGYKKDWVSDPDPVYSWQAAFSLRGRLWLAGQDLRNWARRQPWLRQAVRQWRGRKINARVASD